MPLHTSVANCRLTVLLVHRISCAILGSQNALIKVGEVLRLWPAVIAILPSLEPQQLSNISRNYSLSLGQRKNWPCKHFMQHFTSLLERVKNHNSNLWWGMVHWRSFGHDFKTQLLEVLSSRYRPTTFSNKSKTSQAVCSVICGETAFTQDEHNVESFSSSGSVVLLLAIPILLQRLTGCCWSLPLFHPCFQYVDNKARLGGACNICPTSKPLQRASSPPLALCSELLWFIQFFSRVSVARLIGIPSNLFPNLNMPMRHRQIGGQSVRFALHKRFSTTVRCLLLWRKICWFQQSRDISKGSGSTDVCQELLRSTHRWIMNAQFYMLTFKIWIQLPLPRNIAIAIYPGECVPTVGCAKTQESICLKSSIGQLLMWTSGLVFTEEKMADYSLSSCMQHTQGWNSFQARRRQRGIVQL